MEALEKNIEVWANRLLNEAAINIQMGEIESGDKMKVDNSSDDSMEIDREGAGANLFSKEGEARKEELLSTNNPKSGGVELCRSARNKIESGKIQERVEVVQEKNNEISGKISPFAVFNFVDSSLLEKLASTSNINLGRSTKDIANSISTIQVNEIAKATLLAAKQRILMTKQKEKRV